MKDKLKERLLKDPRIVLNEKDDIVEELWQLSSAVEESKPVRKAAKKALYILGSRGVDISRKKPKKKKPVFHTQLRVADDPLLSVPDSQGYSRLIIPVVDDRGAAFTEYRFILSALDGMLQFSSAPGSKNHMRKLLEPRENGFFPVSPEYALFRLDQAINHTDVEHISGLESLPDILRVKRSAMLEHPVLSVVRAGLTRIFSPEEEKRIFTLDEIARLSLSERDTEEVRTRIREAQASKLILENKSPQERFERIIDSFFKTYFTEVRCSYYRTLLFDIALFCRHRGLENEARILVHTAQDFHTRVVLGKKHPVANYLVYQAVMAR
jgi:hypothetical protein